MADHASTRTPPLILWHGAVQAEWLDYNGHMTEYRYLQVFGEASDGLYAKIGVDFERASESAYYTLQTHVTHLAEGKLGASLHVETELLGYDEKRLHLYHRLFDDSGSLLATGEHLSIHVKQFAVRAASDAMLDHISQFFERQRTLPTPDGVGSVLKRPLLHSRLSADRSK